MANLLNILSTRKTPMGEHQPIRLRLDGGPPGEQLWFLLPMLVTFVGIILALLMAVRLRWLFFDTSFWVPLGLLVASTLLSIIFIYWTLRQLYLLRIYLLTSELQFRVASASII